MLLAAGHPGPVVARDLPKLASVLARVFLAEDFAAVCALRQPGFLEETSGPLGTIHAYAGHMKNEVVASLRSAERKQVLSAAAGAARDLARQTLRERGDPTSADDTRLATWCALAAKSYVRQIVGEHDQHHTDFTQSIATAAGE